MYQTRPVRLIVLVGAGLRPRCGFLFVLEVFDLVSDWGVIQFFLVALSQPKLVVSLKRGKKQKNHHATLFLLVQHLHLANHGEGEIG